LAADTLRETGFLTTKTEGNVAKIILRTIEQRLEAGKKLRDKCPHASHGKVVLCHRGKHFK
jgi:hypothetical protein